MISLFRKTDRPPPSEPLFQPPQWQWAQTGDVGWWVRDDWQRALLCDQGLRLDEWRDRGQLTVVKNGPHRVVYRVDLAEGPVYIKHFLVPGLRAKVRQWLRRGKGRNESWRTRDLAEIGVATITPIALGEQRKRKILLENYLITHAIPEMVPLDEFIERTLPSWPEERQARVRQDLATELGTLTARLHDAGFAHQDFHPGNILVGIEPDGRPRLAMIDLDALRVIRAFWQFIEDFARIAMINLEAFRVSRPLNRAESQQNLALLNHYFWLRCGRAERYRFLKTYLEARQTPIADPGGFTRGIEEATRSWAERLWRRWGRRCQGGNKYFQRTRGPHAWSVASRDLDPGALRTLLADPDSPFRNAGTLVLKSSRTTTVAETTLPVQGKPVQVIYKRFNRKKWLDPFLTWFRPSRAWQAWQAGQHLASRGIPTPRNLAFIARQRPFHRDPLFWYLPHETYLITLKDDPVITLRDYVFKVLPELGLAERLSRIRTLTLALARLLRALHERSLSDRDLKAANILIVGDPSAPDVNLSLIDLGGVRLKHPLPRHRRVQNLARLNLSLAEVPGRTRTDALRFLRAYLPWGLSPRNDWKGLYRAVAASSREKRERNRRHGRVLS